MSNIGDLNEYTKKELLAMANGVFGLNMSGAHSKDELIAVIKSAQSKFVGNAEITVVDEDDESAVKPGFIKVRVQPGRHNPKNRPIFVSHQFRPATVPVNVDVIIPAYYENCLKDALQIRYHQEMDEQGKPELVATEEHSYPYSVLERG